MKKLKSLLMLLVAIACLITAFTVAISAEETTGEEAETITISFMNTYDVTSTSTSLDKTAHSDGAATVKVGEEITLPTTSSDSYTGKEGFRLIWYTENGRTYNAGEKVSFTEDTKLFRRCAKEVSTSDELQSAISNDTYAAVLLNDIERTSAIGCHGEKYNIIFLNGYTLTFNGNINGMGATRTGKHIYGKGTVNFINSTNTPGTNRVFDCDSHGWYNHHNMVIIGADVTLNAPNHRLYSDNSGNVYDKFPMVKIYGKVNVAHFGYINGENNKTPRVEIFEGAEVTISSTFLSDRANNKENNQRFLITVTGGKFNLPEEATDIKYWSADFRETYVDGKNTITVKDLATGNLDEITITGGSFNIMLPDGLLKNGYQCIYNDETGYYDVTYVACTLEGSEGVHNFIPRESFEGKVSTCDGIGMYYFRCECGSSYVSTYEAIGHSYEVLVSETPATCTTKANKVFKCIRCDATSTTEYGSTLGHSYTIITIETQATATSSGVKRVTCDRCADTYTYNYAFDPREQNVTIVVNTADGAKEITVKVSDLYDITLTETTSGYTAKINKINTITDPDDAEVTYTIADIIKIVVPTGITHIATDTFKNGTVLTDIILLDGADATFASGSIENCVNLERITLGNCTVTFNSNVIDGTTPNNLTIDAANGNFYMKESAFDYEKGLKKIIMGSYKTYNFEKNSLRDVGLEEFIVPDYANLTAAYATFYQAYSLKYVYIGRGITTIDNIFDQCKYLQKIVLMDVTTITGQYFACLADSGEDVLRIYHHADTLSVAGRFLHKSHGVILYTNATGWTGSMDSCSAITKTVGGVEVSYPAYTIVKGIPHEYKEGNVDATCTAMGSTGYTTDCPCGTVASATYTTYKGVNAGTSTSNANVSTGKIEIGATIGALGHEFDEADGATVVGTTPAGCATDATITYKCVRCDETKTVVQEATATSHNTEGVEWVVITQPACTTEGFQYKTCTLCNTVAVTEVIPATGHNIEGVEWTKTSDPTCTLAGTEVKKCTVCNVVVESQSIDALGHIEGEFTTVLNPDCDDNGLKEQYCTRCEFLIATEAIEKLGHEFDTEKGATIAENVPAGCLNDASTVYKCARCNDTSTVVYEESALGHEFDVADGAVVCGMEYANGFNKEGAMLTQCARCTERNATVVAPIFEAKGYSTNPDKNAINGGYSVNTELLALYESYNGAITYGVVIANANSFTGSFFNNGAVNTEKAIQVPITMKSYSNFDLTLSGFGVNADTLELVICAYVIDEDGNATFIQAENDYAVAIEIGGAAFTKVTLALVVANATEQPDALVPSSNEE